MSRRLDRKEIRRAFERAATDYDQAAFLYREVEERLLERVELLKLNLQRIVDLGSGPGRASERLKRRYRKALVLAVDLAAPMAALARARSRWMRPVAAACADALRLPLAANSVDLVFSNLLMPWIEEREACFDELRRVLRPGGALLFTTLGPDTLRELRQSWGDAGGSGHVHEFDDMHHLGDELLRAGFRDPVMDSETITVNYPDPRRLMLDLKATGTHNASIDRPRSLAGKSRYRRMLDAYERFREDGGLPATWEVIYGHALAPEEGQPRRTAGGQEASFSVDNLRRTIRRNGS